MPKSQNPRPGINDYSPGFLVALFLAFLNGIPFAIIILPTQGKEIIRGMMDLHYVNKSGSLYGHVHLPEILFCLSMISLTLTSTMIWDTYAENEEFDNCKSLLRTHWLFLANLILLMLTGYRLSFLSNTYYRLLLIGYSFSYILLMAIFKYRIIKKVIWFMFGKDIDVLEKSCGKKFLAFTYPLLGLLVPIILFIALQCHWVPADNLGPLAMATAFCNFVAGCFLFILIIIPRKFSITSSIILSIIIIGALFYGNRSSGDVSLLPRSTLDSSSRYISPQADFDLWLDHIQSGPDGKKLVVVALCSGGGIRAASFASQVLGNLQDEYPLYFFQHLYALSGVSGGSLAIATVAGEMMKARGGINEDFSKVSENVTSRDLLTPVFYHLLLEDVFCQLVGVGHVCKADRSSALDGAIMQDWNFDSTQAPNQSTNVLITNIFKEKLDQYEELRKSSLTRKDSIITPVVLFSSTDVNSGRSVIISSESGLKTTNDSEDNAILRMPNATLQIGTAVSLSARFPVVTAPGHINLGANNSVYLTDGGYSDNSGARAMLVLLKNLFENRSAEKLSKLRLLVLQIDANPCHSNPEKSSQQECAMYMTPAFKRYFMADAFTSFEGIRVRNTNEALKDLKNYINNIHIDAKFIEYSLSQEPYVVPLGWYISTESQQNIKSSILNHTKYQNDYVGSVLRDLAQDNHKLDYFH